MDFMKYIQIKRKYEERTGEEFPGLGEDRQRRERQKAAEERAARDEEADRAREEAYPPPRRFVFPSNRRRSWK